MCSCFVAFFERNGFLFFQGHVLDALGVTDDWYRECNETLSLVIGYCERERWECLHAVAACRDHAPPKSYHSSHGTGYSGGLTDLITLLCEVHEEYCETVRGHNGQGRAGSFESIYTINSIPSAVKFLSFLNLNCIILSESTVTV